MIKPKKISKLDKLLLFLRNREFILTLNYGCNPEVTFKDGAIYRCSGTRVSVDKLLIRTDSIRRISAEGVGKARGESEVVEVIREDLAKDGIIISLSSDACAPSVESV